MIAITSIKSNKCHRFMVESSLSRALTSVQYRTMSGKLCHDESPITLVHEKFSCTSFLLKPVLPQSMTQSTTGMLKKNAQKPKRRLLKDKLGDLPIGIDRFNYLIKGRRYQLLMRVMELFSDLEGMYVNCQDLFKLYQQVFGDVELMQHFGHLTSLVEWLEEFSWVFRIEHLSQCYISLVENHKKIKPDQHQQSSVELFASRVVQLVAANSAIYVTDLEHLYNKTYCTKLVAPMNTTIQALKAIGQLQKTATHMAFMIRDASLVPSIRVKEVPPQFVCQEWTYGLCSLPPNECRLIHASMVSKKYLPPLCHFNLKGTCHYGDSCFFRHSSVISSGLNADDTADEYLSLTPSSWLSKTMSPTQATPTFTTTGISSSVQVSNMPTNSSSGSYHHHHHHQQQPNSLPLLGGKKTAPPPIQTHDNTLKVMGNSFLAGTSPPDSPWSPLPNSPFATSPYHSCTFHY